LLIDAVSKPYKKIDSAKNYISSDSYIDLHSDSLRIMPLEGNDSAKTILPMQAADFMAWELRKASVDRKEWNVADANRSSKEALKQDYDQWAQVFFNKYGRMPRTRQSAWGLEKATPQKGHLWDFVNISGAHTIRHKNGRETRRCPLALWPILAQTLDQNPSDRWRLRLRAPYR
jgi:hypothetical protein